MTSVPSTKPPPGFAEWISPHGYRASDPRPYQYEVVEVWNGYNLQRYMLEPAKLHPAQNVASLYWRPIKAFGEEMN